MPRALALTASRRSSTGTPCLRNCAPTSWRSGRFADQAHCGRAASRVAPGEASEEATFDVSAYAAVIPPWSAGRPYANLYGPKAAARSVAASVVGNVRVTEVGKEYDTHHIVLDFGAVTFPVLEGQSIGIIPPGAEAGGRPLPPRQIFDREPAQRRAAGLQQRLTHREAGVGGPSRPPGARRRQQLSLRLERRRQGPSNRTVRRQLPDAQPPEKRHRDDLHRHRQRADARDDRVAQPVAQVRQVRWRQTDAVLRRPHQGGASLFRAAREPAQGLHRHQLRLQPHGRPAQAPRAGLDARPRGRSRAAHRRPQRLFLCLRVEGDGGGRCVRPARHRDRRRVSIGRRSGRRSSGTDGCTWKPTDDGERSFRTGETHERRRHR